MNSSCQSPVLKVVPVSLSPLETLTCCQETSSWTARKQMLFLKIEEFCVAITISVSHSVYVLNDLGILECNEVNPVTSWLKPQIRHKVHHLGLPTKVLEIAWHFRRQRATVAAVYPTSFVASCGTWCSKPLIQL